MPVNFSYPHPPFSSAFFEGVRGADDEKPMPWRTDVRAGARARSAASRVGGARSGAGAAGLTWRWRYWRFVCLWKALA